MILLSSKYVDQKYRVLAQLWPTDKLIRRKSEKMYWNTQQLPNRKMRVIGNIIMISQSLIDYQIKQKSIRTHKYCNHIWIFRHHNYWKRIPKRYLSFCMKLIHREGSNRIYHGPLVVQQYHRWFSLYGFNVFILKILSKARSDRGISENMKPILYANFRVLKEVIQTEQIFSWHC